MLERGWSKKLARSLALELGVSQTTLYADRRKLIAELG